MKEASCSRRRGCPTRTLGRPYGVRATDVPLHKAIADADASGYAAGGATVLATGRTDDDRVCHEVLIETAMESRATDQRVATYGPGQLAAQRSATTTATGRINPVSWRRAQPFRWNPVSPATRDTGPRTVVN